MRSAVYGLADMSRADMDALLAKDMLGDDLEEWLAESALMKRTFRACAMISGLIERRFPGKEKTGRQITVSTDLVYDVLRRHEPDHVLLRAAWADAATGLLDIARLSDMLSRIKGRIIHKALDRVSPLAVPIMLEIGKETVYGEGVDRVLAEAADELIAEATGAGTGAEDVRGRDTRGRRHTGRRHAGRRHAGRRRSERRRSKRPHGSPRPSSGGRLRRRCCAGRT